MNVQKLIAQEFDYMVNLRRHFHCHPEVSMHEHQTCLRIEQELDGMNIPHKRVGETGVFAWIDGGKGAGKCIALRADIDALGMEDLKSVEYRSQNQGACHACGHDGHTATVLTAAKILKSVEERFSGQVRLFFQQGEEYGQGARLFIADGHLDGCDRIYGAHVTPKLKTGQVAITKGPQCASCDYFKITVEGKGAHVSTPHLGIDAVYIGSQIVVQLQSIVARATNPLDTVVVGIGVLQAGTQYNVVAQHATIEGTTRSFSKESREKTNALVTKIAKDTAQMYGATAEVTFLAYSNPVINHPQATEEVQAVAKTFLADKDIITDYEKILGADDFADYQAVISGVYTFYGTHHPDKENTDRAQHHGLFDIDEDALKLSTQLYVSYALEYLK